MVKDQRLELSMIRKMSQISHKMAHQKKKQQRSWHWPSRVTHSTFSFEMFQTANRTYLQHIRSERGFMYCAVKEMYWNLWKEDLYLKILTKES